MSEPVWKEFRYQVHCLGGHAPDAECVQVLAQVMSLTFADLPLSKRLAVAAWFTASYGDKHA